MPYIIKQQSCHTKKKKATGFLSGLIYFVLLNITEYRAGKPLKVEGYNREIMNEKCDMNKRKGGRKSGL